MKFFNLDLHISVIADVKKIFVDLGHEVDNWTLSGHAWVFGRDRDNVDFVNEKTWRQLDESLADKFYERYKDELSGYDGFIVTHTPCFSMLYKRFDKPIITIASTRYEEPFSNNMVNWLKFNRYLQKGIDSNQIIPIANNKYDSKYTEQFTQRSWQVIPSLCEYTGAKYTGAKDVFLYSSKSPLPRPVKKLVPKATVLPSGYTWQDLAAYRGIVHVPYNASTMSIFEQYTSNIPLFFPSLEFLKELRGNEGVLSELSWNQVWRLPSNSCIPAGFNDPNNYLNNDIMMEWAKLSDFYDLESMPGLQHFDSFEHLEQLLDEVNTAEISDIMKVHNIERKRGAYESWRGVLKEIS